MPAPASSLYEHDSSKVSKASVDYSRGMGNTRCKNCMHFKRPNACLIVRGEIDPEFWCKGWTED